MAIVHKPRVKFATITTGTGPFTVGTLSGVQFMLPADAGSVDGDIVNYVIEEGSDFEEGWGVLSATATVCSRNVFKSKIAGVVSTSPMSLNGNALVRFIFAAEDMLVGPTSAITDGRFALWDTNNRRLKQHTGAPGTAAIENVGTSGANLPKMSTKNDWSAPQKVTETALTTATAWDGDVSQNLTVNVNTATFAIANPSPVPSAGIFVAIRVVFTTTHVLTFGNKYLGMTGVVPSNTAAKVDNYVFRSDGTNLHLVGYRLDVTT